MEINLKILSNLTDCDFLVVKSSYFEKHYLEKKKKKLEKKCFKRVKSVFPAKKSLFLKIQKKEKKKH
jgi:hypothetical protein